MIFILSLQDIQGENNLVNLIEDWTVLEEYAGKSLVSTNSSQTTEKSNSSLNTKMSSQDILETARTSQLSCGRFTK